MTTKFVCCKFWNNAFLRAIKDYYMPMKSDKLNNGLRKPTLSDQKYPDIPL
jgi:hypothetical protein